MNDFCTGCIYQVFKPSKWYGGVVEGCKRSDWTNASFANQTCYDRGDKSKAYIKKRGEKKWN